MSRKRQKNRVRSEGEKHPWFVILLLRQNYNSSEIETGREMCEREEIAKEGENGDLEKRSVTDLAKLPLHLTPLLSRTVSVKTFTATGRCQRHS